MTANGPQMTLQTIERSEPAASPKRGQLRQALAQVVAAEGGAGPRLSQLGVGKRGQDSVQVGGSGRPSALVAHPATTPSAGLSVRARKFAT